MVIFATKDENKDCNAYKGRCNLCYVNEKKDMQRIQGAMQSVRQKTAIKNCLQVKFADSSFNKYKQNVKIVNGGGYR